MVLLPTELKGNKFVKEIITEEIQNEYFGGGSGKVTVTIEGEGELLRIFSEKIEKLMDLTGGDRKLFINGKESHGSYRPGGTWM